MKIYKQNELDELASILKNDGIICVPTDTVYGICARINSKKSFDKLTSIKNRPNNKPFPVVCLNEDQIKSIAIVNATAEKLIRAFMPGAITLVLNKKPEAFSYINNSGEKDHNEIAVRIIPLKALNDLIQKIGTPIFLTSANLSGEATCQSVEDIEKTFPNINGILEGKPLIGQASTIVDCTSDEIKIQRSGPITIEEIMKVLK